jgi:hypothetical protein
VKYTRCVDADRPNRRFIGLTHNFPPVSTVPAIPTAHSIPTYIEDGARIAAILLVWGVMAAFFTFGVSDIGGTGGLFERYAPQVGTVLALTGILNAVLYVVYRAIDYWHHHASQTGE